MGALPKRRISTRRKGKRRAKIGLKLVHLVKCPSCGSKKVFRQVCKNCSK